MTVIRRQRSWPIWLAPLLLTVTFGLTIGVAVLKSYVPTQEITHRIPRPSVTLCVPAVSAVCRTSFRAIEPPWAPPR